MNRARTLQRIAAGLLGLLLAPLVLLPASPAHAAEYRYEVAVLNKTVSRGVTQYGNVLGSCGTPNRSVTCGISVTKTTTRTIGVSAGVSVGFVAAQLGISSSSTQQITVSCSGKPTAAYPYVVAYVVSDVWSYTVQTKRYDYYSGVLIDTLNSHQYAYDPKGFRCALSSIA